TFTLSHRFATLPLPSTRYVVRAIPMNDRPYSDFFCHTPYFSATSWSASASNGKVTSYFAANFALLASSRMLIPTTAAFPALNFGRLSRNAQVSLVQPGVSSFG